MIENFHIQHDIMESSIHRLYSTQFRYNFVTFFLIDIVLANQYEVVAESITGHLAITQFRGSVKYWW